LLRSARLCGPLTDATSTCGSAIVDESGLSASIGRGDSSAASIVIISEPRNGSCILVLLHSQLRQLRGTYCGVVTHSVRWREVVYVTLSIGGATGVMVVDGNQGGANPGRVAYR